MKIYELTYIVDDCYETFALFTDKQLAEIWEQYLKTRYGKEIHTHVAEVETDYIHLAPIDHTPRNKARMKELGIEIREITKK